MSIYQLSKSFPEDERFGMTSQIRRSSRSVCANIAEGWRKRRYEGAFIAAIGVAEAEAAETQCHLEFCVACSMIDKAVARTQYGEYNKILRTLVGMNQHADSWLIKRKT